MRRVVAVLWCASLSCEEPPPPTVSYRVVGPSNCSLYVRPGFPLQPLTVHPPWQSEEVPGSRYSDGASLALEWHPRDCPEPLRVRCELYHNGHLVRWNFGRRFHNTAMGGDRAYGSCFVTKDVGYLPGETPPTEPERTTREATQQLQYAWERALGILHR